MHSIPAVIGRPIAISGTPFTIIGVTPPEFYGLEVGKAPDLFLPIAMQPTAMPDFENLLDRPIVYLTWLQVVTRVPPGHTAQQVVARLMPAFLQELPKVTKPGGGTMVDEKLRADPAATGISELRQRFSQPLIVLMGIVGMVLLIACANTASLLLARAASRRGEFGVRLALGASRARLIRQLLVESIALSTLGGVFGILLAIGATRLLLIYMSAGGVPISLVLTPDLRVLGFTGAVSLLTGICFGLAPALRSTRLDLTPALKPVGRSIRGGLRSGKILCVAQVALSLVLLVGAGLFVRSLAKLNDRDAGVDRDTRPHRTSGAQRQRSAKHSWDAGSPGPHIQGLLTRVAAFPGVRSASLAQFTPTTLRGNNIPVTLPSGAEKRALVPMVYPNYFATMGIAVLAGRDFDVRDLAAGSPLVAIVNETFARQAFGAGVADRTTVAARRRGARNHRRGRGFALHGCAREHPTDCVSDVSADAHRPRTDGLIRAHGGERGSRHPIGSTGGAGHRQKPSSLRDPHAQQEMRAVPHSRRVDRHVVHGFGALALLLASCRAIWIARLLRRSAPWRDGPADGPRRQLVRM